MRPRESAGDLTTIPGLAGETAAAERLWHGKHGPRWHCGGPGVLADDDEGLAEALCRSEEMDRDPGACLSHDEFLKAVS
jgi:hypothetical protein